VNAVDVYHGTSEWAAERILRHGLVPYRNSGRVYVTSNPDRAKFFAAMWTAHMMDKHGGRDMAALICFRVPADKLLRNPDDWQARDEFIVRGSLPASMIEWHWMEPLGVDLADARMQRAIRKVQRLIDTGSGGPGCPRGCRDGKPAHRTLVEVALSVATPYALRSKEHGLAHWLRVVDTGVYLARRERAADLEVVRLFGALHDTQRLRKGRDPLHGPRAADVAREHEACSLLDESQREQLTEALYGHSSGQRTDDPTIGVCWDADRLNLWRFGRTPLKRFLSMDAARDPETVDWALILQHEQHEEHAQACMDAYPLERLRS
jgi:uncharacterized protein